MSYDKCTGISEKKKRLDDAKAKYTKAGADAATKAAAAKELHAAAAAL
jgi:hypothetical protein